MTLNEKEERGRNTKIHLAVDAHGLQVRFPSPQKRYQPRSHDQYLYKLPHLVENAFLKLKQWRGIATRYAKRSASFLATVLLSFGLISHDDTA